jgi:hypothetical protein
VTSARRRAIVVGDGLSGLAAALRLQRAGVEVSLLQGPRPRAAMLEDLDGIRLEPRLFTVPSPSPILRELADELGLADGVRTQRLDRIGLARGAGIALLELDSLGPFSRIRGVPPWQTFRWRRLRQVLERFGDLLDPARPTHALRLDDRSASDFVDLYLGRALQARFFQPLLDVQLGLDSAWTSRALLLLLLDARGVPALELAWGVATLRAALAMSVRAAPPGTHATSISADAHGVALATGERLEADAIVVAVPGPDVLLLAPPLSPYERLFFERARRVERSVLALRVRAGEEPRAPVVWIPARERGLLAGIARVPIEAGAGDEVLLLVAREGLERLFAANDEHGPREALLRRAEELVPGLRERVRSQRLFPRAYAAPAFDVGHYRAVARLREEQTRQLGSRPLVFGGDYLVAPHVEGELAAGLQAAEDTLQALASS